MQTLQSTKIVNVPSTFRFQDPFFYPSDNVIDFEYWLSLKIGEQDLVDSEREYLPITWTAFYKRNQYGENLEGINKLQIFLDGLDTKIKYWTVCQWDLGILNDLSDLDIKVFSMAGKPMDYPLPLISQPHKYEFNHDNPRTFKACFVGANTHPVRSEIYKLAKNQDYFISHSKMPLESYCGILADSVFSLCPRGFSSASFRCQESLQYQSIPLYVSDSFIEGHYIPFETYGIKIDLEDVSKIPEILNSYSNSEIEKLRMEGQKAYKELYTFEANKELILKNI